MTEPQTVEAPAPSPETTLADHVSQFPIDGSAPVAPETPGDDDAAETAEPAAERRKDGTFAPRHRAASQKAGADDVETIAAHTKRLREAEAEFTDIVKQDGESERAFNVRKRAEIAERAKAARTAKPAAAPSVPRETARPAVETRATDTPAKPKAEDVGTTYATYEEFVEKLAEWTSDRRDEARTAERVKQNREASARTEFQQWQQDWDKRTIASKAKYPDFQTVALDALSPIPPGSVPDLFVREDEAGQDVLYYLHQHPDELNALLNKPALQQVKVLSLLAQRLTTSTSSAADTTGAAPRATSKPDPRPPTPVRSGPIRAKDDPPGDDASLAEHEAYYAKSSRR